MFESPTAKLDHESYRCDEARISLLTLVRLTESGTNKRKMKKSRLDVLTHWDGDCTQLLYIYKGMLYGI